MTDPITASVMTVLGKYAIDNGVTLAKEAGPAAAKKAGELFKTALAYLRRDTTGQVVADEFEQDPETYEKPVARKLENAVQTDPALATELQELLAQYQAAAQSFSADSTSYQADVDSGAAAQGKGSTAVGERGVYAGGNVSGGIVTGDHNIIGRDEAPAQPADSDRPPLSPAADNLRLKIAGHFNVEELKNLCQDMGIVYENLGGKGREGTVRELIDYCQRHDRLDTLRAECKRRRPEVEWE